jgi:membrane-associated phospholipid phosphatase
MANDHRLAQYPAGGSQRFSCNDASWALLLFVIGLCGLSLAQKPMRIDVGSIQSVAVAWAILAGAALFYSRYRAIPKMAATCWAMLHILLFSAAGSLLSYLLARTDRPFVDGQLRHWDSLLGFDWWRYVRLVDASPLASSVLHLAYGSLVPQIIIICLCLGLTDRLHILRTTILAAMLTGTITILLSPLFPAESNFIAMHVAPDALTNVSTWAGYAHINDLLALRNGRFDTFSLSTAEGIITFPSYHAGLATVTLWSFWQRPRMGKLSLRWPGCIVALLTIAATPVDGGHYLSDVIAGMLIAAGSIAAAKRLVGWQARLKPSLPMAHGAATSASAS